MRYHSFFPGLRTDQIRLLKEKIGGYHFSFNTFLYNVFQCNSMSRSVCGLEKNFQTWGRMRGKESLLEWETLLEQQASSGENQRWTGVLSILLYPGYKEWDRGLAGHLLIGWGTYPGWGKSKANTFSLWGRRENRLYCSGGPEIR